MKVRDALRLVHPSRNVVITDLEDLPLEEGIAGALLDESMYLDSPAVHTENDFPYVIMAGITI